MKLRASSTARGWKDDSEGRSGFYVTGIFNQVQCHSLQWRDIDY